MAVADGSRRTIEATRSCPPEMMTAAGHTDAPADTALILRRPGKKGRQKTTRCSKGQPHPRHRAVSGNVNQVRADGGREAPEDGGSQAVGECKTRGPHSHLHCLGQ